MKALYQCAKIALKFYNTTKIHYSLWAYWVFFQKCGCIKLVMWTIIVPCL